jgi:cellobiose phosphorylase
VAAEEKNSKRDLEKKDERKAETARAAEESTSQKQEDVASAMSSPSQPASPTQRKGRSARASSDSDASHHKKASVMNMVKGEMKVLLGKASRNKGKVEEGEKLKHGSD